VWIWFEPTIGELAHQELEQNKYTKGAKRPSILKLYLRYLLKGFYGFVEFSCNIADFT